MTDIWNTIVHVWTWVGATEGQAAILGYLMMVLAVAHALEALVKATPWEWDDHLLGKAITVLDWLVAFVPRLDARRVPGAVSLGLRFGRPSMRAVPERPAAAKRGRK